MPTSLATRRRKALRADLDTDSELVFYCPECADRELSEVLGAAVVFWREGDIRPATRSRGALVFRQVMDADRRGTLRAVAVPTKGRQGSSRRGSRASSPAFC